MKVEKAIEFFNKVYADRTISGYWEYQDSIILFAEPRVSGKSFEVCYYLVQPNGDVIATNPLRIPEIAQTEMIKIKRPSR